VAISLAFNVRDCHVRLRQTRNDLESTFSTFPTAGIHAPPSKRSADMSKPLISHVGIAVADLSRAISRFRMITEEEPVIEEIADQKVKVAIFPGSGINSSEPRGRIELVAATEPGSPIASFIEKRGEGLHHVCLYVEDVEKKLSELKAEGIRLIDETPRIGAGGRKIAFVHPSGMNGVLIELEEAPG